MSIQLSLPSTSDGISSGPEAFLARALYTDTQTSPLLIGAFKIEQSKVGKEMLSGSHIFSLTFSEFVLSK